MRACELKCEKKLNKKLLKDSCENMRPLFVHVDVRACVRTGARRIAHVCTCAEVCISNLDLANQQFSLQTSTSLKAKNEHLMAYQVPSE